MAVELLPVTRPAPPGNAGKPKSRSGRSGHRRRSGRSATNREAACRAARHAYEREQMRARLKGLGFHGEKRAAVRDPEFRKLPAKVREALARTSVEVLDSVYDDVPMEELHRAVGNN